MSVPPSVRVQAREGSAPSCSFCKGDCDGPGDTPDAGVTCGGCQAVYHRDCLGELGACATIGCPRPIAGPRVAPAAAPAGAGVRRIRIPGVRCCHRPVAGAAIALCDACGARWHADCAGLAPTGPLPRGRLGACCADHGFSPEQRLGRARQDGPRVGSERSCSTCGTAFTVEAGRRFSPLCGACRWRSNLTGVAIVVAAMVGYTLLVLLSGK